MVVESGVLIRGVRSYKSCWRLLLYCPVPVSATDCGLLAALLRTVMVAERAPVRLGLKVTEIVQLPPTANPVPPIGQLFVCANRAGLAPPSVMLLSTSTAGPGLLTVMVCAALVVLIGTVPNAIVAGDRAIVDRMVVPVNVTVPETAGAATFTRTRAERVWLLLGVNVTVIVQLPPAASPVPPIGHFCVSPKRPGLVPPSVLPLILSVALPGLDTVTV